MPSHMQANMIQRWYKKISMNFLRYNDVSNIQVGYVLCKGHTLESIHDIG